MKFHKFQPFATIVAVTAVISLGAMLSACVNLLTIAISPKTLIDLAIEARSSEDIIKDNRIVLEVNAIMAKLGTIQASTEIYEQRLLITGLFDDRKLYKDFLLEVKQINNIKALYWHIRYLSEDEQKRREQNGSLIGWVKSLILDTQVGLHLFAERGVADVNYRVAADAFSHVYLIGRARSTGELKKALAAAREVKTAKKIVNYVVVRP